MSSAVAFNPNSGGKWTVIGGPMRGAARIMAMPNFVIGRSPECEFVIAGDPKVSRRHAQVVTSASGCEITSLNEKNLIQVNGLDLPRARLRDGDVVVIGATELQYHAVNGPLALVPNHHGAPAMAPAAGYVNTTRVRTSGPAKQPRSPTFYVIVGVIALIGYWLAQSNPTKKKQVEIRTEKQIEADIEAANKLREVSEAGEIRKVEQSITLRQAQENYVRGFRDFRKGQFERALISFQACLALNPEHALCTRYLRLSQRKFDELIQYEVVLGRKYRDQNQYQACRASFRNVMVMVKDASSRIFQEAKANYEACNSLTEGRY